MHPRNLWFAKEHALGVQSGCNLAGVHLLAQRKGLAQPVRSNLHAPTRNTKQRNVDFTTDGLWAMPLNTGWVPVKARRLQDAGKLNKYVPIYNKQCPNGFPALVERDNSGDDSGRPLCIAPPCVWSNFQLCAQKCDHLPPPNP